MIKEDKKLINNYLRDYHKNLLKMRDTDTLEDFYNLLYKNKPHHKNKLYNDWNNLEGVVYEELLIEDENPKRCEELIDYIIEFLEVQKKEILKNVYKR